MDYKEEIIKAAEVYSKEKHPPLGLNEDWKNDGFDEGYNAAAYHKTNNAFIAGSLSKAAKNYWYNEFKQTISVGILNQINDLPTHKVPEQCPDVKYLVDGSWDKYKEYIYYNPDRPISFNNWKYMVEL